MGGALGEGMVLDTVIFTLKRASLKTLRAGNEFTKEFGLTPARFDLLHMLKEFSDTFPPEVPMTQRELRDAFGVTAPVVSRMLRSLERLRLVRRGPRSAELRTSRPVRLTAYGLALIRRAAKRILHSGRVRRLTTRGLRVRHTNREQDLAERYDLLDALNRIRHFFHDPVFY